MEHGLPRVLRARCKKQGGHLHLSQTRMTIDGWCVKRLLTSARSRDPPRAGLRHIHGFRNDITLKTRSSARRPTLSTRLHRRTNGIQHAHMTTGSLRDAWHDQNKISVPHIAEQEAQNLPAYTTCTRACSPAQTYKSLFHRGMLRDRKQSIDNGGANLRHTPPQNAQQKKTHNNHSRTNRIPTCWLSLPLSHMDCTTGMTCPGWDSEATSEACLPVQSSDRHKMSSTGIIRSSAGTFLSSGGT